MVYAVAAFAQLVVGRMIDHRAVKPILIFVAAGQPVFRSDGDATGPHFVRSDPAGHGICLRGYRH